MVKDDSADVATRSDDELSDWAKEKMIYAEKMLTSFDSVDKRLVNLLNIRREQYANNGEVRKPTEAGMGQLSNFSLSQHSIS